MRRLLHRFIPATFHDPVGLARRLLQTGHPGAIFAMQAAVAGLALSPLDLLLVHAERKRYARASRPTLPLIFVCGPPRSGTTLTAQVLIKYLPVSYVNNLTSIFPRAPVTANHLWRGRLTRHEIAFDSYYGRTPHLDGINDGLYLWDRWLGTDRARPPAALTDQQAQAMTRFFGAWQEEFGLPLVEKNNALNASAHLVASVLDAAHFICLARDPVFLAQSLLKARQDIHADAEVAYGIDDPETGPGADPVEAVCRQVVYHERLAVLQRGRLAERFSVLSYEEFCADPQALVRRVAGEVLGKTPKAGLESLDPFKVSKRVTLDAATFNRIEPTLERLRAGTVSREPQASRSVR